MTATTDRLNDLRPYAWGATATLILLPLFVLKLADPNAWAWADLPFAGVMIVAVGIAFEVALRLPLRWTFRAGAALAIATAFLLTWGNLAVGFAGSEDNPVNMIFLAVPGFALAASLAARFRARGLALAMAGAAAAQLAAGLVAHVGGHFTGPLTVAFTGLWLAAALLFLRASQTRVTA